MEQAVEEEDFDLDGEGVVVKGGLAGGGFEGDGEVSGVLIGKGRGCGEAQDIGGLVFAAEVAVESAEGGVSGEEDVDVAAEAGGEAGSAEEGSEDRGGEAVWSGVGRLDGDHG
jgi:hypothetical protein